MPGYAVTGLYSGWLDSFAFVAGQRRVSVYDLTDGMPAGTVELGGTPGPGVVTADGSKLFLPIEEQGRIAVIDTRLRRLIVTLQLDIHPTAAAMAGASALCH